MKDHLHTEDRWNGRICKLPDHLSSIEIFFFFNLSKQISKKFSSLSFSKMSTARSALDIVIHNMQHFFTWVPLASKTIGSSKYFTAEGNPVYSTIPICVSHCFCMWPYERLMNKQLQTEASAFPIPIPRSL